MRYTIHDGTVSAGGQTILAHIDFEIKGKEKIALVGRNGAGKTTLLRLVAGELSLDRDDRRQGAGIVTDKKLTVGMLRQSNEADFDRTVEELFLMHCPEKDSFSKERFLYEMECDRLFTGFGFEKSAKKRIFGTFSGGEQTKIALIRLLLKKPDILLLDEPTNHLDIASTEWLERCIRDYDRAVIIVSHDRFFIDRVAEAVYEISDKKAIRYAGNYTAYRAQKRKDFELQKKAYDRQQQEIARLNGLITQFKNKAKKAAFARSRKTILSRMETIAPPREDDAHIFTGAIEPAVLGSKWVFTADHLKIGYTKALLELSLRVRRGAKIGIIGPNGAGKSTFLKTIAGEIPPFSGEAVLGNNTVLGYFSQQSAAVSSQKTVIEHFRSLFPAMTEKEVRTTLAAYLFGGKNAAKRVDDLSGGEKSRLLLAELLCSRPNLLLLDEPTNHMDIPAKETLESAFSAYTGTILFVSHDRYFIEQVADAILVFEEGRALYYPFGYEHYLAHAGRGEEKDLTALISAENQALVADLKAVPKAERHRLREIGTEEAYVEWQLRLQSEPLFKARDRYFAAHEAWTWCEEEDEQEMARVLDQAEAAWTDECLRWYALYLGIPLDEFGCTVV